MISNPSGICLNFSYFYHMVSIPMSMVTSMDKHMMRMEYMRYMLSRQLVQLQSKRRNVALELVQQRHKQIKRRVQSKK